MRISQSTKRHNPSGVVTGPILAGLLFSLVAIPTHAATTTVHTAAAYGARVEVNGKVTTRPVALAELPDCSTAPSLSVNESVVSISKALVTTGAVTSSAVNTADTATASNTVAKVNLLGGMITATKVEAVSTSSVSGRVFQSSAAGSEFTDLKVLGNSIPADVAPNTVIELPSLGSVTLNEQTPSQGSNKSALTVVMIHVSITMGENAGTDIVVGDTLSEIKSTGVPAAVGGYAKSPELVAGSIVEGLDVVENIPCFGTYGTVETQSATSSLVPGVFTTGGLTVTGAADLKDAETSVASTTSTANLVFLGGFFSGGLIQAKTITSEASGTTTDGETFNFSGKSTFVGLEVPGYPAITDDVAPNTKIKIPNLGNLYFNRVEIFADSIRITPIELVITATNSPIGPAGTAITVGVAEAQLHSTDVP